MRSLILSLLLLAHCSIASAQADPPVIVLPPEERQPSAVFHTAADAVNWGVVKLNAPAAHKVTKGSGVRVAILDTGVDTSHPDLADAFRDPADSKDFTRSGSGPKDVQGHGTHCAGRAFARGVNHGVAPEAIGINGKVLSDSGSGSVDGIAAGIRWAAKERKADVISMSLGGAWCTHRAFPRHPTLDLEVTWGVARVAAGGFGTPVAGWLAVVQIGDGGTYVIEEPVCCGADVIPLLTPQQQTFWQPDWNATPPKKGRAAASLDLSPGLSLGTTGGPSTGLGEG